MCGRHGAGLDWPEEKGKFSGNALQYYTDLIRAVLPIYYGTSASTFCQISGLKETFKFEKINKHQTALKLEF